MSITGISEVMSSQDIVENKNDELGKSDFLNLLVAQLENQDPLNPMDSTDFTAQLAQFSALEQMTNVNTNLESLLNYQNSLNNARALDFMGKSVKVEGNSVEIGEKNGTDLIFELESDAMSVNINIFDKYGSLMKIIECGSMGSGSNNIYWDGTNYNGEQVSDGTYTFNVNAVDFEGNSIATNTFTKSGIESVVFKDGIPYLVTRESEFPIGDVIEIFENENNQE